MVGWLPHPAALDSVRCEQPAPSVRGMRSQCPVLRLSDRPCILDELVSPRGQVQFALAQPALGGLVRVAQGLADAYRLYRLRYSPPRIRRTNVCRIDGGAEAQLVAD